MAILMFIGASASGQIILQQQKMPSQQNNHSVLTIEKSRGQFAGWHGAVELGAGPHVYSASKFTGLVANLAATGIYEFKSGIMLGAAASYNLLKVNNDKPNNSFRHDVILEGVFGYMFATGPSSMFVTVQPGASFDFDYVTFGGDVKIGYRYMFKPHLGIIASTGIRGSLDSWMIIPLTVGLMF